MKKKYGDFIMCGLFALSIIVICTQLPKVQAQARIYPIVLIAICFALLAMVIIEAFRAGKVLTQMGEAEETDTEKANVMRVAGYVIMVLIYILLIPYAGYVVSTIIFAAASLLYQKKKNILLLILLPLICSVAMFYIFKNLLYVTLPIGIWFEGLMSML
ncbi:MAG: tripartite tricarboxylate transporter TctB family protein [Lachnospiraceae bacterium]|nr:tripartite tricarboxylate transporter TctB family protein [Lachnospiraceae bacterium]